MTAIAIGSLWLPAMWAQAPQASSKSIGFSYNLPEDWEVVKAAPAPPSNLPPEVRKGAACTEIPLTARHGDPISSIVVVALPFDCFGETMSEKDLPEFGAGVLAGLKQTFDFANPLTASYKLAGHAMWINRMKATPRGKTAPVFTIEIACTLLTKGAVCWLAQAADMESLRVFEHSPVTLENVAAGRLVPKDVFVKDPAPAKAPRH